MGDQTHLHHLATDLRCISHGSQAAIASIPNCYAEKSPSALFSVADAAWALPPAKQILRFGVSESYATLAVEVD